MTTIALQPGNIRVVRARLLIPWRGVWLADLELDPDVAALAPKSGKVQVVLSSGTTLIGTIDPRGSGQFVEFQHLRVLGGGGGWDKIVGRQHFHSDAGVRSLSVYGPTGALVGETVAVTQPRLFATDFTRVAGPASLVLEGEEWWTDLTTGTTFVGPRPVPVPDTTLELMSWDASEQRAELKCQSIVLPGTLIVDSRIPSGAVTARDVEQVFDESGSTVQAWCGTSEVTQLMGDLEQLIVQKSGRRFLASYDYRVVSQAADGRLALQSLDPTIGVPDMLSLAPWPGVSGASAKIRPASLVRVSFLRGDPSRPIVDLYDPASKPLEATYDGAVAVHVGPGAALVKLAGGATPLATGPYVTGMTAALQGLATSLAGFTTGPLAPLGAVGTALQTALAGLPPPATTKVVAQ